MKIDVAFPFRGGDPQRERLLEWTILQYGLSPLEGTMHLASGPPDGPFNRSAAINEAAAKGTADVVVVADTDCFCDVTEAIDRALEVGWAVPHLMLHRLSRGSTEQVLAGSDWRGLPLSQDNPQDRRPYRGNECGTLVVLRRDVLERVPPDPRFVGWGGEDEAWAMALRSLVGPPWRGKLDLPHLWHEPQPRRSRSVGSLESAKLLGRYRRARASKTAMRVLVDEYRTTD